MKIFKEIQLSNIFDIEKGNILYTNTYMNGNIGDFPVFSSQTTKFGEIGRINTYDYNCSCITWTTDGIHAGTVFLRKNIKFSMTTHCGALIPKIQYKNSLYLDYIYYYLSVVLKQYAIGNDNKRITSGMIKNILLRFPIKENGEFDLEKQKEIASKYERIEKIKNKINIMKGDYENKILKIDNDLDHKLVKIDDIMISPPTNSGLKKENVSLSKIKNSDIPVYSASKNENLIFGWVSSDSLWKKYENVLTRNKDGSSGMVFYRNYIFIPYEKVKVLKIKENYIDSLDYDFLKKIIQKELLSFGYSFGTKCSMDNVLKTEIKIPVKENGEFDLEKQKEIASKYEKLEKIQKTLIEELEYLEKVKVEI